MLLTCTWKVFGSNIESRLKLYLLRFIIFRKTLGTSTRIARDAAEILRQF